MKPMLSYLIIISLQVIAFWEVSKWLLRETCTGEDVEPALFMGGIVFELVILGVFNWVLYEGGFYRLPWGW